MLGKMNHYLRKILNTLTSVVVFFFLGNTNAGEFSFGIGGTHSLGVLKKAKVSINKVGPSEERLELAKSRFKSTELYLDFENKKPDDLKDKNNNYDVRQSIYTPVEFKSLLGRRYASFTTKESQIRVYPGSGKLMNQSLISSSFYISFYIMPGDLDQSSNVFSKTYITGGKKYGIDCKIINTKIEVTFHNFFSFSEYETKTYILESPDKLKSKAWSHVVITLEPSLGTGKLYENGQEKVSFQAIRSREDKTPLLAGFHPNDTSPLIIGKDFYGKLDNFQIGRGELPDVSRMSLPYHDVQYDTDFKQVSHTRGIAYSPVYKTKYSHSLPIQIDYKSSEPPGTHLEVHYRFSEEPFDEEDTLPEWKHFDSKSFHDTEKETYFQYFQWKLILRSNFSGLETPSLRHFSFKFKDSIPPNSPSGLRISKLDNSKKEVCLAWNSNHESDVIDGGGYIIHYGVDPGRMVGTLSYDLNGNPITGLPEVEAQDTIKNRVRKNYLSLEKCVNNDIIRFNAEYLKDKNLLFLKSGITYYFRLTAFNNKYPLRKKESTIGFDQKSQSSRPASATFSVDIE